MPGFTRRNKPLKGTVGVGEIDAFAINNPQDGQLLIYDGSDAQWENGTTLSGNLVVAGTLQGGTVESDGALTVGGAANITGNLDVVGGIETDSTLLAAGGTTLNSTLSVAGAATLSSTLGVTGLLSGGAFSFTGNGSVGGDLSVTGTLTTGTLSLTNLVLTGDITAVTGNFTNVIASASLAADSVSAATGVSGLTGSFSTSMDAGSITLDGDVLLIDTDAVDVTFTNNQETGKIIFKGQDEDDVDPLLDPTERTLLTLDPEAEQDMSGTVYGLILPSGTTAQQPGTPTEGTIRYNSTDLTVEAYINTAWTDLASGGAVSWIDNGLSGEGLYNSSVVLRTNSGGIDIADVSGGDPVLGFYEDGTWGTRRAFIQMNNVTGLYIDSELISADVHIRGRDSGGGVANLIIGDPNAEIQLYYDNVQVFETVTNGIASIDSTNGRPSYYMRDSAGGSERASFQAWSDNHFYMTNSTATGDIVIRTRNYAGSSNITSIRITAETVATDDTAVELYHGTSASYPNPVISTVNYGARLQRGNGTGTPVLELYGPTTGNSSINFTQTTNTRAQIQYNNATELYFRTIRTGEGFRFYNDVDGTLLDLNSGGSVDVYHNGNIALSSTAEGIEVQDPTGTAPTIDFNDNGGTQQAFIEVSSNVTTGLRFRGEVHGARFRLQQEDSAGTVQTGIEIGANATGSYLGFHGTGAITKPTVTGSRGGNAALASLLTALANYGLITDSST